MPAEAFLPLLLVASAILLWGKRLRDNVWMERLMVVALAIVVLRYLNWRFFVTVLPADVFSVTGVFVWFVFLIEALAWLDTVVLFAYLLRRSDRTPEADIHEARLRDLPPDELPEVDIFIATYNEPAEVLEKTIVGAVALDWPAERLNVWVLDDGRRDWLKQMSENLGARYLTRADNAHAKAGNINEAVARTTAPFFLVLDADFIPQRNFLFRSMGFFQDPKIGIVQIPHNFFNPDPMQASLNMSRVLPDDQRFFFEVIMPGRDGYDCAFCCGSNGIIRRSALEEIGNKLPSGSITEDMLLTIALKRKGYITRYLDERLAFGLAPENINAFFIQRSRWARGAIQIMFLKEGPFGGPGLRLHERLFFLPLHWITQSFGQSLAMATPAIFLLTGIAPMVNATAPTVISYQFPAIVATIAAVQYFAPGKYHPLTTTAHGVLQAFRLLPVVAATLLKPHGHAFKVTPKGSSGAAVQDTATVTVCLTLCVLMGLGLFINADFNLQIVPFAHLLPIVAFWSILNMILLLMVAKIAITPPLLRSEERFELQEDIRLHLEDKVIPAESRDMSLNGALVVSATAPDVRLRSGDWLGVEVEDVGVLPAQVRRVFNLPSEQTGIGLAFALPPSNVNEQDIARDGLAVLDGSDGTDAGSTEKARFSARLAMRLLLIRKLFTQDLARKFDTQDNWAIGFGMLRGIFSSEGETAHPKNSQHAPDDQDIPGWLMALQVNEAMLDEEWCQLLASRQRDAEVHHNATAA